MKEYSFTKTAGYVIDAQDDVSETMWSRIQPFWPDWLEEPQVGQPFRKTACIASIEGRPRYPIDTAENALASSYYFLANAESFDKEAMIEIGLMLKEARRLFGVRVDERFLEEKDELEKVAFVDNDGELPVDTPEDFVDSLISFKKNAELWSSQEQVVINYNFEKVAEQFGIEDISFKWRKNKFAKEALLLRRDEMKRMGRHEMREEYMNKISYLAGRVDEIDDEDIGNIALIVGALDELDKEARLDVLWNEYFPTPLDSIVEGHMKKESEWDNVDWDGLADVFSEDVLEQIKNDPDGVVPTLPAPQKAIFNDYIRSK